MEHLPPTLIDLLLNNVIARRLVPELTLSAVLSLSGVNKALHGIVNSQPEIWQHLDLTSAKSLIINSSPIDVGGMSWRAERMDEGLTEDEFYSGPLRGAINRLQQRHLLQWVQILVLDGLSVPVDLIREVICEDQYTNVRILSIRECKNVNQTKLQQLLRYAVRPTRPENTPKLRALYCFGQKDHRIVTAATPTTSRSMGVLAVAGAQIGAEWNQLSSSALPSNDQERWYSRSGRALRRPQSDWPDTLQVCKGIIAFDAVLCRGPRHDITKVSSTDYLPASIANVALGPKGCDICGTSPEGPSVYGQTDASTLPLIAPPPNSSATVRAAQRPDTTTTMPPLFLRCEDCLRGRWCERCSRWWCESCYETVISRAIFDEPNQQTAQSLQESGWETQGKGASIKVYSKLCVEHCLRDEIMMSADGYWG